MGDDWAEDGLALVHGEQVANGAGAVFIERAGVFEKVEDCGEDLYRGDGGVKLDSWEARVGLGINC